jgi:uncharacterized protein (DUF362 family)
MSTNGGRSGTRFSRRTFLRATGAVAAMAGAAEVGWRLRDFGTSIKWDPRAFSPPGDARVAVLRAASYDGDLEGTLLEGLRKIGADVRGARVLLKPNMVEFDLGASINTDPRLVVAAVHAFRRMGAASVTVGEGPGHRRDTRYVLEASGLGSVLREAKSPFVDLNVDTASRVPAKSSYTGLQQFWIPHSVRTADVIVSMPKMKTHHWMGVTLSLKNCFGVLPGRVYGWPKNALHWAGVGESILDIAGVVRPALAIVDGIVGMEGNGPIDGVSRPTGALVVGNDPVATDVVATRLMGFDPERVPYLVEAGRFLGQGSWDQIIQEGEDPDQLAQSFAPAPGFSGLLA